MAIFTRMSKAAPILPKQFNEIYKRFQANISRHDCGWKCAPLNGGQPVCCDTSNAVPVVHKAEWQLLSKRTDLWHKFKVYDAPTRKIVDELPNTCTAIECKGAQFCERDNRTMACRAFPFFPYITKAGEFIGLSYYWDFEDRCWVISNLGVVEREFIRECVAAFERLFKVDPEEFTTMRDHSASMRRVFTRRNQIIPIIGRDFGYFKVMPGTGGVIKPAQAAEFKPQGPYRSDKAYARAVKEAKGTVPPGLTIMVEKMKGKRTAKPISAGASD